METTHLKPYPTNGFTHPAIDLAVRLRRAGLRASDIATVVVGVPTPTLRTIAEPLAAKRRPATPYEARFSGPFTVAVALRGGGGLGVGLGDLTPDALTDPGLLSLVDRIEFTGDPEADAAFPGAQLCRVTVTLHDGTVRTAVTESTKPTLTEEEQLTKLDSCLAAASRPTAGLRDATLRPVPDLDPAALYAELLTVLT
nr:hypothetical protein [Actinomadura rayongensis]